MLKVIIPIIILLDNSRGASSSSDSVLNQIIKNAASNIYQGQQFVEHFATHSGPCLHCYVMNKPLACTRPPHICRPKQQQPYLLTFHTHGHKTYKKITFQLTEMIFKVFHVHISINHHQITEKYICNKPI